MGPGDIFQTLFGRPPAEAQLATALGQGPGQAGSPQGPQPLAGQNAPPGGPAGPGGSPDPSGGPSQPQQPPQPQVYQSPPDLAQAYMALSGGGQASAPSPAQANAPPPDLAQMYMAYMQQNQAKQDFWGGLAGIAQGLHPGRVTPGMVKSITGTQQDPASLFQNLMQMQQYSQQNQAIQAFRQNIPALLKAANLPDSFGPALAIDPQLASKIAESTVATNAPTPEIRNYNQAAAKLKAQGYSDQDIEKMMPVEVLGAGAEGMPPDYKIYLGEKAAASKASPDGTVDPKFNSFTSWQTDKIAGQKTATDAANDRDLAQKGFTDNKDTLETLRNNLNTIINAPNLGNVVGGQWKPTTGWLGSQTRSTDDFNLASTIDQITKQIYTEGFSKAIGSRKTQAELSGVAAGQSQLANTNLGADAYRDQAKIQLGRVNQALANLHGEAGYSVPDDLQPFLDSSYASGQRGKTIAAAPAPGAGAASAQAGGNAMSAGQAAQVKAAIAANPHDRDKILSTVKANGFDVSGF